MPIEHIAQYIQGVNWTMVALIAGSVGAVALSWSRILDLIDLWLLKVVHSGNRGYVLVLGIAVRWWRPGSGWHLLVLPPFVYPQLIFVVQVREFSVTPRPTEISEQAVYNKTTGKTYRVGANAAIRYAKDGMNAKKSQVLTTDPDGVARLHIKEFMAQVVGEASPFLLNDREALNKLILTKCGPIVQKCGVCVDDYVTTTLAVIDAQMQKDGLLALAESR